jgi:general stress protein YciG
LRVIISNVDKKTNKMTRQESGRLGGLAARANHITLCPCCGQPIKSRCFSEAGQRGGEATLRKYGRGFYQKIGRMGGRGNKKQKPNGLGRNNASSS